MTATIGESQQSVSIFCLNVEYAMQEVDLGQSSEAPQRTALSQCCDKASISPIGCLS